MLSFLLDCRAGERQKTRPCSHLIPDELSSVRRENRQNSYNLDYARNVLYVTSNEQHNGT
jgi:hypothetical protein